MTIHVEKDSVNGGFTAAVERESYVIIGYGQDQIAALESLTEKLRREKI